MDFFLSNLPDLLSAIGTHLFYTFISVFAGGVLGVAIGTVLSRFPSKAKYILPALSVFNTIPGVVFVGLLFILMGIQPLTVVIALSIYAMFPVMKNTFTGLTGVDRQYIEAALGCGMSGFQKLCKVELPIALPSIISGFRMSLVYTVSWTVLAAMIGLGGLGTFIYRGIASNDNKLILLGAIPAAILAFVLGSIVDVIQKHTVPKGLRTGGGK